MVVLRQEVMGCSYRGLPDFNYFYIFVYVNTRTIHDETFDCDLKTGLAASEFWFYHGVLWGSQ